MMKLLRYALLALLGAGSCLVLNAQMWPAPLLAAAPVSLAQGGDRFATFIQADQLYRSGNASAAANLYRQVKPPFPDHADTLVAEPLYEPEELPSADLAFWNVAQRSIAENQVSGAIGALEELTQRAPGFILGHLQLAQILQQNDQSDKALAVLEQAATLHPTSSDVVMAHIKALQGDGQILEASIAARSFAIINPDHPQVGEFRAIADN
ncbi:MAG TPA: tetratricopeptide repeat protein, partial [Candidatus Obscuribacterales bacterium]